MSSIQTTCIRPAITSLCPAFVHRAPACGRAGAHPSRACGADFARLSFAVLRAFASRSGQRHEQSGGAATPGVATSDLVKVVQALLEARGATPARCFTAPSPARAQTARGFWPRHRGPSRKRRRPPGRKHSPCNGYAFGPAYPVVALGIYSDANWLASPP